MPVSAEELYKYVKQNESKKYAELLTVTAIIFLSFLFFLFYGINLADAVFVYTQGPVIYTLSYYFRKKDIEHELVGILFTYIFAILFYAVIKGVIDFLTTFFGLVIFLAIKFFSLLVIREIKRELSPSELLFYGFLIAGFIFLLFSIAFVFV
jgi:drug/metabolite transporter (DMT)-like permease